MNHSTRVIGRLRRPRPPAGRTAVAVIATAGLALLTAACGGSPSSAGSGDSPSAGRSPSALAFSHCMRSHGVPDFPDPGSTSHTDAQSLGVSDSTLQAAGTACGSLDPKKGQASQALTAQQQQVALRVVACMRSHGITNLPDPTFSGGRAHVAFPAGMSTTSPQFTQALQICQKLIPPGFPGGNGSAG